MRVWCIWCRVWLRAGLLCEVLPAGLLWPLGASLCTRCCGHVWHKAAGASTDQRGG